MSIQKLLQQAQQRLAEAPALEQYDRENALREAQILLMYVLDCRRSYLIAYAELELTDIKQRDFLKLIEKRYRGEPIAYLIGQREFYSLPLDITEAVLIPRPETELLVDHALLLLPENGYAADLGTGSGAIAIALAKQRLGAHIFATDISMDALQLAQKNAAKHELDNIQFYPGDWLEALPDNLKPLDLIASNPPYVHANDHHLLQGDCRFEPKIALTPGNDATSALQQIIQHAPKYMKPSGWLLLEHGYDQAEATQALFKQGPWQDIRTVVDLGEQPRVTMARLVIND